MSGLLLSGCCGCAGGRPDSCRDDFDHFYNLLRYQLADTPGGSVPVELTGWETYPSDPGHYITLDGEGSFTVEIPEPSGELVVGASIYILGVGASAGVTIRRADSSDNISLWWMGGTGWELRQGSTVLESISHAGSGEFRLILKTPLAGTTDVEVWLPHAMTGLPELVHTESAVTFVAPSELWHVGLIVDGEAAFDYLESSPCPKIIDCEPPGGCLATVGTDVPPVVPVVWTMSVPAIGNNGETLGNCIPFGDDDFVLVRVENAVAYDYGIASQWEWPLVAFDPLGTIMDSGDPDIIGPTCGWVPVIPNYDHRVFECSGATPPAVPAGKLPVKWLACPFGDAAGNNPTSAGESGVTWLLGIQWRNAGTMLAPDMEYRVVMEMHTSFGTMGDYIGAWVKYSAADLIEGSFVLSNTYVAGCDVPATISVTAGGQDAISRRVLECWDTACTPPVTPQPGQAYCMSVTLVDDADTPITYSVSMGVGYNETTGSWEWTGFIDPWEHPTCGMMDSSSYKIHCVEPAEGAAKQWVLDITTSNGTSRIALSEDPEFGPVFDGTLDVFCTGETWDVFAMFPNVLEDTTDIFGCVDNGCHVEGYCVGGVVECEDPIYQTCGSNSYGNHLGATSSNPPSVASKIGAAFTGPWPLTQPANVILWLWKDGSGIHLGAFQGGVLVEEATPIDIDCDQGDKIFKFFDPSLPCCSGFGGDVTVTLIPCGGPIVHV